MLDLIHSVVKMIFIHNHKAICSDLHQNQLDMNRPELNTKLADDGETSLNANFWEKKYETQNVRIVKNNSEVKIFKGKRFRKSNCPHKVIKLEPGHKKFYEKFENYSSSDELMNSEKKVSEKLDENKNVYDKTNTDDKHLEPEKSEMDTSKEAKLMVEPDISKNIATKYELFRMNPIDMHPIKSDEVCCTSKNCKIQENDKIEQQSKYDCLNGKVNIKNQHSIFIQVNTVSSSGSMNTRNQEYQKSGIILPRIEEKSKDQNESFLQINNPLLVDILKSPPIQISVIPSIVCPNILKK